MSAPVTAEPLAASKGMNTRQAKPVDRRFGPFVLRHSLGHSSETMAWHAVDTRTRQNVWIMMPRQAPVDERGLADWLEHARQAARLAHPRIVPVLEASHLAGKPYVVCEARPGWTPLRDHLAEQRVPPFDEAVGWALQLLEGVACGHEAGVMHGDLGLHTIAIDAQGRLMTWGWGAAGCRASVSGVPGSVAHVAELRECAAREVARVGMLLFHWLSRQWAAEEPDLPKAHERLATDIVRLPWDLPRPVPEALRAMVNRAVHRHPKRRYLSARGLERALDGWRQVHASDKGGALVLLKDRLDSVGHLPALPGIAQRVAQLVRMENRRLDALSDVILQDPALSFELLRLVNVRRGARSLEDPVTTVRRSVELIGLAGVRRCAASLRSWPGPLNLEGSRALHAGMKRAWLAGHVAELLCPGGLDAESALLAAQLQHLGRLLVLYHFPAEAVQIRSLMQPFAHPIDGKITPGLDEDGAAMAVLGVDLPSLATAMAQHWGLGESARHVMHPLEDRHTVRSPQDSQGWIRLVATCANEILKASEQAPPKAQVRFERIATRYHQSLGLTVDEIRQVLERAKGLLRNHLRPSRPRSEGEGEALSEDRTAGAAARAG